jgi:Ca-activated chloride channel family protein
MVLDVSPSMKLRDAGQGRSQTRCARAADLLRSVLERIHDARLRVSIIAVYNGAKRVVTDTKDMAVVDNIINDLPVAQAFDIGKTLLTDGVREAAAVAQDWPRGSATVLIVTDGDTVPDSGMPEVPASVGQVLILGVGDLRSGSFIDGHQSFQDASTLRQLAARLRGIYHDGNETHVPTPVLSALARVIPLRERAGRGMRELAMAAIGVGAGLLATLPVLLAIAGVPAAVPVPTVNQQRMRKPA